MSAPVDVLAVLARHASLADQVACREQQAEAHAVFDAIAELIEAAVEMEAVFDTYVFDYGVTQHGLSVKDRIRAALARVGGGK